MRNIILPVVQTLAGSQQNLPGISCVTHNYRIVVTSFKKIRKYITYVIVVKGRLSQSHG